VQLVCERHTQSTEHTQITRIRVSYVTAKSNVIITAYDSANCDDIQKSATPCCASNI